MKKVNVMKKLLDISELTKEIKTPRQDNEEISMKGLNHSARDIIGVLSRQGSMNQRSLSKFVGCSPQAISKAITKLEGKKLIIKESGSQKNENNIFLTELGEKTDVELKKIIENHSEIIFGSFSEDELILFMDMLNRIERNIRN
ncbi:MAG: MarR family winged helix-turn-helix transcriptional regulator [Sedimentibacter sp.]